MRKPGGATARREEEVGDKRKQLHELKKMREVAEDEPADLKPYDVEIVYVMPAVKLEEKGVLKLGLPRVMCRWGRWRGRCFCRMG